MTTHSSVPARRIPGTGEPGGLPSMGSHGVGHDWSDLAAASAAEQGPHLLVTESPISYLERYTHYRQSVDHGFANKVSLQKSKPWNMGIGCTQSSYSNEAPWTSSDLQSLQSPSFLKVCLTIPSPWPLTHKRVLCEIFSQRYETITLLCFGSS